MFLFFIIDDVADLSDNPFYCPQSTTGFYTIDFNTNSSFDITNYCPLSTGNYYDINYLQNKTFDTANYCPLSTGTYYDFAAAP